MSKSRKVKSIHAALLHTVHLSAVCWGQGSLILLPWEDTPGRWPSMSQHRTSLSGNKHVGAVTVTFSISRAGRTNLHCVWCSLSLQSERTKMTLFYLKLTSETALGIMTPNRTSQLVAQTKFSPTETRSIHRQTNGSICEGQGRCKSILDFLYMLPTKKKKESSH